MHVDMKKIKICHVIGSFANGGVEAVLLRYFSHMDLEKYDLWIIGHGIEAQKCYDKFEQLGFHIINVTPKRKSLIKNFMELYRIFKQEHFDIVHSHITEWACIPLSAAKMAGIDVRINHSHMAEFHKGIIKKVYYGVRLWWGRYVSTHYFACGEDAGKYLFGEKNLKKGKVNIIRNAFELGKFAYDEKNRENIRTELEIDDDTICIGNVGRFEEQKNHTFIIDIFDAYQRKYEKSCLILVGQGRLEVGMKQKVDQLKLKDKVKFLGIRDDVNKLYQAMDLFLFPSLYEGLAIVAVEAQVSNLPILTSNMITPETKIIDNMIFMPLNKDLDDWINCIDDMLKNTSRKSRIDLIRKNGYDIVDAAEKLDKMYFEIYKNPYAYGKK